MSLKVHSTHDSVFGKKLCPVRVTDTSEPELLERESWNIEGIDYVPSITDHHAHPGEMSHQKRRSKKIKKVEDYFQWNTLTQTQKDMYYEFVRTAKKRWDEWGYEDEDVRKVCLDKISLIRFCIARDFNPTKVLTMWTKWVEWRLDYQPHLISRKEIKRSSLNKWFYLSRQNKNGNPCIVIKPGATNESYEIEMMWKLATYIMEKATRKADRNGTTQICVLFDRAGMSQSTEKKWLPLYKELSTLIQDYYPERLYQAYVLQMNCFVKMMYNICKPFIAKKTRNKIVIIKNTQHLLEFFDEESLDQEYGGIF